LKVALSGALVMVVLRRLHGFREAIPPEVHPASSAAAARARVAANAAHRTASRPSIARLMKHRAARRRIVANDVN
jgi:hypothetical protein